MGFERGQKKHKADDHFGWIRNLVLTTISLVKGQNLHPIVEGTALGLSCTHHGFSHT